jgi:cation transport ATPase
MTEKLMLVKGMTCPACEQQIVDALVQTGARGVRADSRRGEVVLDPAHATERQLRDAVEALGYRAATLQSLPSEAVARTRTESDQWTPLWLLLPAVCCGAPLLLAAAAALGVGTWLAANRLVVVSALALATAFSFVALWLYRRRGRLR